MSNKQTPKALVFKRTYYEETLIEKTALFGLIRWEERIKIDKLGTEIVVCTNEHVTVLPLPKD